MVTADFSCKLTDFGARSSPSSRSRFSFASFIVSDLISLLFSKMIPLGGAGKMDIEMSKKIGSPAYMAPEIAVSKRHVFSNFSFHLPRPSLWHLDGALYPPIPLSTHL